MMFPKIGESSVLSGNASVTVPLMPDRFPFEEVAVLIPGYTIEDLPVDLAEQPAESLLNALTVAWHPLLIALTGTIPRFRHAETVQQLTGKRILLIPAPTEDWMPHEWHQSSPPSPHLVVRHCISREQWLQEINSLPTEFHSAAVATPPALVDDFLAFGMSYVLVVLLSRRMHHFVDPDESTLQREMTSAAQAALDADVDTTRLHLSRCFELLRETREQFYPLECFLVDFCVPSAKQSPAELIALIRESHDLNLIASAAEIRQWCQQSPEFAELARCQLESGNLCLLTGHMVETRVSLNAPVALLEDLHAGRETCNKLLQYQPRHWARRRFGLLASLPAFLRQQGFRSACHFALDDGIYPDRERSQFNWQAADGSLVAATSRIPVAVESAVAILRLPDRMNESMHDDTLAVLFLARLPLVESPWLNDLRRASSYAPVLGEFTTVDSLTERSASGRQPLQFSHGEYLSPGLIQSSVLKTESPVTGPADLCQRWSDLESAAMLEGLAGMLGCAEVAEIPEISLIANTLLDLERSHADADADGEAEARQTHQQQQLESLDLQLQSRIQQLLSILKSRLPQQQGTLNGKLLLNTLPFSRSCLTEWPASWRLPADVRAIEGGGPVEEKRLLLVRLPPGGFVWLTEAPPGEPELKLQVQPRRSPPLAELLILRNRHFEVSLSSRHGGIESVVLHGTRTNRLSQQVAFRFEREKKLQTDDTPDTISTWYATTRLLDSRVLQAGPMIGEVETWMEITEPDSARLLARCRQVTTVDRFRAQIRLRIVFDPLPESVQGNPWMTYLASRFAWDNELAAISRSVLGQTAGFQGERFESPEFIEIADEQLRLVITTHGRPWHRRTGPRMVDSLLICEGELQREFQFTLDFDAPLPGPTARSATTPVLTVETSGSVPTSATTAWLLGLTARNVLLARVRTISASQPHSASQPRADVVCLRLTLIETEGSAVACGILTARQPLSAIEIGSREEVPEDLESRPDGVTVQLSAWQLKEIELSFRTAPATDESANEVRN